MNYHNSFLSQRKLNKGVKRKLLSFLLISAILFNLAVVNIFFFNTPNNNLSNENDIIGNENPLTPKTQGGDISLIKDPFTNNFSDIWDFFKDNYYINLWGDTPTYYGEGDVNGVISDESIYSLDNLLLYDTLLNHEYDSTEVLEIYNQLKSTPLWFDGPGVDDYGFIESIDGSTGTKVFQRNLIDNLIPISLLIDYVPSSSSDPTYGDYVTPISEMYFLMMSSQFWNESLQIYMTSNSSSEYFHTESNLYAILANLKIVESGRISGLYNLAQDNAENAMNTLIDNLWDNSEYGFYNSTKYRELAPVGVFKDLKVNALGIIALIDYWRNTDLGEHAYLLNATRIYDKGENLFNSSEGLYFNGNQDWNKLNYKFDLEANAYMMMACLKLFEATGNYTYYERAQTLFNTFENDFYDNNDPGYYKSLDSVSGDNNNKNLHSNLRLSEAYLYAVDVYKKTEITASFNGSAEIEEVLTPEFIFNQDVLKVNITYRYYSGELEYYNISNADVTYMLRYSNDTIFHIEYNTTDVNGTSTCYYNFPNTIPIEYGYTLIIYANTTYFKMAQVVKYFHIKSGIEYYDGLEDVDDFYQGEKVNVTLRINNTRIDDINLTYSVESDFIISDVIEYTFNKSIDNSTTIWVNFTVYNAAEIGFSEFHFVLRNGSTIFLDKVKNIEIKNALQYSNLLYDSEIVKGDSLHISLTLTNFLINLTQSFNLSVSGEYIQHIRQNFTLIESEIRTVSYDLVISDNIKVDTIEIEMNISKSNLVFHNKIFSVELVNKFELTSVNLPSSISQGSSVKIILMILNNKKTPESFILYINEQEVSTDIVELIPGENRIETSITPTINPYDFSTKSYYIVLEDSSGNEICSYFFKVEVTLSVMNLILFYVIPIMIPIGIVIFFKNKETKTKLLRR